VPYFFFRPVPTPDRPYPPPAVFTSIFTLHAFPCPQVNFFPAFTSFLIRRTTPFQPRALEELLSLLVERKFCQIPIIPSPEGRLPPTVCSPLSSFNRRVTVTAAPFPLDTPPRAPCGVAIRFLSFPDRLNSDRIGEALEFLTPLPVRASPVFPPGPCRMSLLISFIGRSGRNVTSPGFFPPLLVQSSFSPLPDPAGIFSFSDGHRCRVSCAVCQPPPGPS